MKNFYIFACCVCGVLSTICAQSPEMPSCLEKEKAIAYLETAENLLKKAGDSFPSCEEGLNEADELECGGKKSLAYIEISKQLISDVRKNFPTCFKPVVVDENLRDCTKILTSGHNKSGVYKIWLIEPSTNGKPLQVYCDMGTDGGGWTVIQRRGKFPVQQDFFRDWESYKNGFGDIKQEFWLGNENIRVLCQSGCKIRFDLRAENGEEAFALYQNFNLSSSYVINISNYSGNAEEGLNEADESECGGKKSLAYIEISKQLISDVRENFPTCFKPVVVDENLRDCTKILTSGHNKSGVYKIWLIEPSTNGKPLQVYCDMGTDGGGWTVIQRRGKFPVQQDFFRDWESYKNGFGDIKQEFWLGNENIRVLCQSGCKIRFDLRAENGEEAFALYQNFNLSSSYVINISNYSGNAGDAMRYQNKYIFSTKDKGNTEKAKRLKGGWWYEYETVFSHLNGVYKPGSNEVQTVNWYPWREHENLAGVEIKVKPM